MGLMPISMSVMGVKLDSKHIQQQTGEIIEIMPDTFFPDGVLHYFFLTPSNMGKYRIDIGRRVEV